MSTSIQKSHLPSALVRREIPPSLLARRHHTSPDLMGLSCLVFDDLIADYA
ncbi:hypothetical protein [Nitrosopumilus sp. S4]